MHYVVFFNACLLQLCNVHQCPSHRCIRFHPNCACFHPSLSIHPSIPSLPPYLSILSTPPFAPPSWSRKGKYAPLALLVPRLGPRRLLAMQPDLVTQCFTAMRDEVLCSAIAGFLKALVPAMAREAMGEGER